MGQSNEFWKFYKLLSFDSHEYDLATKCLKKSDLGCLSFYLYDLFSFILNHMSFLFLSNSFDDIKSGQLKSANKKYSKLSHWKGMTQSLYCVCYKLRKWPQNWELALMHWVKKGDWNWLEKKRRRRRYPAPSSLLPLFTHKVLFCPLNHFVF